MMNEHVRALKEPDLSLALCYTLIHKDTPFYISAREAGFSYIMTFEDEMYWTRILHTVTPARVDMVGFRKAAETDVIDHYYKIGAKLEINSILSILQGYLIRTVLKPKP